MIVRSDNRATDQLMNALGGPTVIDRWLRNHQLSGMRVDRTIASLLADRRDLHDIRDSSTPTAMINLLRLIDTGNALSPTSRALLLDMMRRCATGSNRIRGLMPPGVRVEHKTGTLNGYTGDVGYLTTPDGRRIAVVFFARGGVNRPAVISTAARAVYDTFGTPSAVGSPLIQARATNPYLQPRPQGQLGSPVVQARAQVPAATPAYQPRSPAPAGSTAVRARSQAPVGTRSSSRGLRASLEARSSRRVSRCRRPRRPTSRDPPLRQEAPPSGRDPRRRSEPRSSSRGRRASWEARSSRRVPRRRRPRRPTSRDPPLRQEAPPFRRDPRRRPEPRRPAAASGPGWHPGRSGACPGAGDQPCRSAAASGPGWQPRGPGARPAAGGNPHGPAAAPGPARQPL